MKPRVAHEEESVEIEIVVQPGARSTEIVGRLGDALKMRVNAPPSRGKANKACIELLSTILGLPKDCITIRHGHGSRRKRVRIQGDAPSIRERLDLAVGKPAG